MPHLSEKNCKIVDEPGEVLQANDISHYMAQLHKSWSSQEEKVLEREFNFPNHEKAVEFVNRVSDLASSQEKYPEVRLSYASVNVRIGSSEVEGLHENDFILAAKIDRKSN
ncbi:MAG: pterin-4a-carbinolamine dehydratase [Candidatus Nanosalina sp. J07AB43]|jgi:Pterin-4a-carbinolamine dehydratase|nr:MAG: pterin-4a-carbinolamine dehydratase [Candidatus Nanosalina sp. J07AB43]